ncbi:diaminopimelate epimerase [Candidatus Poribacteria bacterium]|nr:diaminopimelate epimerase [Candidatus Poribacteria bacterium]
MANIPFMKLSGAGNDFVIIDNRYNVIPTDEVNFVIKVCARRISVGADGLLLVENSDIADFKMRYFNSDGSEVATCGNGARCIAKFAYVNGIASKKMRFETKAGIYEAEIIGNNVKVSMSDPTDVRLNFPLRLEDETDEVCFANSGVPHVVFFAEDLENTDVFNLGRETRYHDDFNPAGTNANFVRVRDEHAMDIRTYERGVEDETLACGTGAIASAVVSALLGKVAPPVAMHTAGGYVLTIYFNIEGNTITNVRLEGDARIIYSGELNQDAWDYFDC